MNVAAPMVEQMMVGLGILTQKAIQNVPLDAIGYFLLFFETTSAV